MSNIPHALGRYEVAGFLASGGMAEVFLGRVSGPSGFDRPVVLKRILPHLARQPSFVDMFLDEARIVARMRHPNVVHVHELVMEGGELFMVMEYLEGESLAGLARRSVARGETLDPAMVAYIVAEACAGLHAAHELRDDDGQSLGVVHRDVSPQNVVVTFAGGVKILDFGIAKAQDRLSRTETGALKGKLEYMSPEQCQTQDVDRRADVFALGIILFEMLTLRRLFKRATPPATLRAVLEDPILPPSRLVATCPPELDAICLRALERDPDKRYPTAADMRRDLVLAAQSQAGVALPEERLAALMLELFADRKQAMEEMLRRVREGSNPTQFPAAEVDDSVEIPIVVVEDVAAAEDIAAGSTDQRPDPSTEENAELGLSVESRHRARVKQAPGRRLGVFIGVVAIALTLVVGQLLYRASLPPLAASAATVSADPAIEAEALTDAPAAASAAARMVQITVESEPAGASVVIGGVSYGTTPVVVGLAASDQGVTFELSKRGFMSTRETVVLDEDRRLRLTLPLAPRSSASARPTSKAPSSKDPAAPPASDPLNTKW